MNVYPSNTFQGRFFKQLEQQFDKRGQMVNAVCNTLNLGRDAVYRRLRGDTALTANELFSLAQEFKIQLDNEEAYSSQNQQIEYPYSIHEIVNELEYYQQLEKLSIEVSQLPGVEVDYASPELPIYYEFLTPTLLAFKVYRYGLNSWNFDKWKGLSFRPELIDPKVFEIADRLVPLLFKIPCRELWSVGILDITLRQIEHAVKVGQLNDPELVAKMFEEIEMTIKHMAAMATSKKRFPPGREAREDDPSFLVYYNELTNTDNVIIIKSPYQSYVFSTFVHPNYLVSKEERIQTQMETWFDNLTHSSNVLDCAAGQYCRQYFVQLRRTVKATENRVNGLLG
jgi:hypothetical protein